MSDFFFFSSRRRHTRYWRDWSSDVCSSDLGQPEHVINFFFFVAEELRQIMASLGMRTLDEMIGRTDLLVPGTAIDHWKARGVDLSNVLAFPELPEGAPRHRTESPPDVLSVHSDWDLVEQCRYAIDAGRPIALERPVTNVERCVGGILSSHIAA